MKKIEIKNNNGDVIFEFKCKNNSKKNTILEAIRIKIDLRNSDLSGCDLRGSNLRNCDLRNSNLRGCDLRNSNLSGCDLRNCDLRGCDLRNCDLDMSNWSLLSKSLHIKNTSLKLRIQLCFHWMKLIENEKLNSETDLTLEERELFEKCKNYANKFHRNDVEKLK